jgi:hypothetical protein
MTHPAAPLPGANLAPLLTAGGGPVIGPDGNERTGVLFVTDDMITQPLPKDDDPHNVKSWQQFEVFCATVERLRNQSGEHVKHPWVPVPELAPGPVVQPCHVRALRSGPWKLVRYCDPWSAEPVPDEWELYHLESDPTEQCNLVVYDKPEPTVIPADQLPEQMDMTREAVVEATRELHRELMEQEAKLLASYPSAHPSAGASAGV